MSLTDSVHCGSVPDARFSERPARISWISLTSDASCDCILRAASRESRNVVNLVPQYQVNLTQGQGTAILLSVLFCGSLIQTRLREPTGEGRRLHVGLSARMNSGKWPNAEARRRISMFVPQQQWVVSGDAHRQCAASGESRINLVVGQPESRHALAMLWRPQIGAELPVDRIAFAASCCTCPVMMPRRASGCAASEA